MISLIITLVAIALVVAIALATMYFGGSAFTENAAKAEANRFLAEGQQITAALTLYNANTSTRASSLDVLVPEYLKTELGDWGLIDGMAFTPQVSEAACVAYNQNFGIDTVPACSDSAYLGTAVCCTQ